MKTLIMRLVLSVFALDSAFLLMLYGLDIIRARTQPRTMFFLVWIGMTAMVVVYWMKQIRAERDRIVRGEKARD
ncbi:MAG: hypothetical protein JWO05_721 [Gemmatimonadetes bacterium]|nr:hypothetical protein [Gemmatimonadota bacterium]